VRRIKLVLEYDGTAFHGWQSQKNASAVQDLLQAKLTVLLKEDVKIAGAGRTDAGVHARGQVAAFSTASDKPCAKMLAGLNGLLPRDVRVRSCEEAPEAFDPRRDPLSKTYRYVWWDGPSHPPFWRRYSWHARQKLDDAAMAAAAAQLVGEHDFSSFRASGCTAKTPVRRILKSTVVRKGERVTFEIQGTAFLHQMVRIIAGTLYDVGIGARAAASLGALLQARDRKQAGKTAPPEGLILWNVEYGAIPRPGRVLRTHPPAPPSPIH
jgi:tRNA pseudouridine38-40 synthase